MFTSALGNAVRALSRMGCVSRVGLTSCRMQQIPTVIERSLWHACRFSDAETSGRSQLLRVPRCGRCIRTCVCGLSTAVSVDKDIADFLADEIKLEKESEKTPGELPTVAGFEVTDTDGANVVLTKKSNNEIVTVTLNVNNTVNDEDDDFEAETGESSKTPEPQMVSKPPFLVEITNSTGETLAIQCSFPLPEEDVPVAAEGGPEPGYVDTIEIQDVAFLKTKGDWTDTDFTVQGSIMDGTLYDMLLSLLESRGINADFVTQLVEFSTAFEHRKYIGFLSQLQQFVSK